MSEGTCFFTHPVDGVIPHILQFNLDEMDDCPFAKHIGLIERRQCFSIDESIYELRGNIDSNIVSVRPRRFHLTDEPDKILEHGCNYVFQ